MQQVENELDQVQEQLTSANNKLDEKEKALQNVSGPPLQPAITLNALLNSPFLFSVAHNLERGGGSQPSEEDAAT